MVYVLNNNPTIDSIIDSPSILKPLFIAEIMKKSFSVLVRFFLVCSVFCALGSQLPAETPEGLAIQMYAGLSITGTVGAVYSVEYSTDLASWTCADFVCLPSSPYLWIDKSASVTAKRFYRAGQATAPTNMVYISPGTFRMGSPTNEVDRNGAEGPQTVVTLSRGFWMGKYEVTQAEYLAVMGNNPSWFNGERTWNGSPVDYGIDLTRPVETVSWTDATAYCAALTTSERVAGRIAGNCAYRLPTEAEWEYACRAMTSTRYSYGDDPTYSSLTDYAWYNGNSNNRTHPVGGELPNPWGLYDMHGNVAEWCQDYWHNLSGGAVLDPQNERSGGTLSRMIRSSGYSNANSTSRSAFRRAASYTAADRDIGFRVVLAPVLP